MALAALIGGAAFGSIMSLIGNSKSAADRSRAQRMLQEALGYYKNVMPPNFEDLRSYVKQLAADGMIDPKTEMAIMQLDAEGRSMVGDGGAVESQKAAAEYLKSVMNTEGMTPQDQAYYAQISDRLAQQVKSQEAAIMANMKQRGVSGGGQELAARMSSAQNAGQQANRDGLNLMAMATQRKDAAAQQLGNLGLQMRQQAFGEALNRDQLYANIMQQNYNMGLGEAQLNYNTRMGENQAQMARASGMANAAQGLANNYNQNAERTAAMWGGLGQAGAGIGSAVYQNDIMNKYYDTLANAKMPPAAAPPAASKV